MSGREQGRGAEQDGHEPEVPDLDLPVSRAVPKTNPPASTSAPRPPPPQAPSHSISDDFGGLAIERGGGAPMASPVHGPAHGDDAKQIAIDMSGGGGFGFDGMEIERGGGNSFAPPMSSGPPSRGPSSLGRGGPGGVVSANSPTGSGLELSYRRADAVRRPTYERPSTVVQVFAFVVPLVVSVGTLAALVKVAHRPGRSVVGLLPHAFDATSTMQSGAVALSALVLSIAFGWMGAKSRPRSYAMIGSAAMLLVASLAMVTVTLVSTEENATADGARLIPYVMPAALLLLGLGVAARGWSLFLAGGARRAATVLVAVLGGALVFAAIELSALGARLP